MASHAILIAGFGGQGIQFSGKLLAYIGMYTGKQVTLMPSYGAEMRGGVSNCAVHIDDGEIASPLVPAPTALVVMNAPSFDSFEKTAAPGAKIFVDSTMVDRPLAREDVTYCPVPATALAEEHGCLANVILCGRISKELGLCGLDQIGTIMQKLIPAKKPELYDVNMKAFELGYAGD